MDHLGSHQTERTLVSHICFLKCSLYFPHSDSLVCPVFHGYFLDQSISISNPGGIWVLEGCTHPRMAFAWDGMSDCSTVPVASNSAGGSTHISYLSTSVHHSNQLLEQQKWIHNHCIWCGFDRVLWHKCHNMVNLLGHKFWNFVISQESFVLTVLRVNIPWLMYNNANIKRMESDKVYLK